MTYVRTRHRLHARAKQREDPERDAHDDRMAAMFGLDNSPIQEDEMATRKATDDKTMSLAEVVTGIQEREHQNWPAAFTWLIEQANTAVQRWGERMKTELRADIEPLLAQAKTIEVTDGDTYQQADAAVRGLKEGSDVVGAKLSTFIDTFNKLHKFGTGVRTIVLAGVDNETNRLRVAMGKWKSAEENKRREEERQIALKAQQEERDRLARESALRKAQGDEVGAAMVQQQAETAPAPAVVLPSSVPDLQGTSFTTYFRWRPIGGDTPENRKRLAMTIIPRDHLMLDDKSLNGLAERSKGTARVPGIEFYSEELPTQRRRSA